MDKLEEMQWRVVRQEGASEAEGRCLQKCGQTSSAVGMIGIGPYRGLGYNEMTRSTTRSK